MGNFCCFVLVIKPRAHNESAQSNPQLLQFFHSADSKTDFRDMLCPTSFTEVRLCLLAVLTGAYVVIKKRALEFPIIYDYSGDYFQAKASHEYHFNAKSLLT